MAFQRQLKESAAVRVPGELCLEDKDTAAHGAEWLGAHILLLASAQSSMQVTSCKLKFGSGGCCHLVHVQENAKLSEGKALHPFLMRRTAQPDGVAPRVKAVMELTSPPLPPLHVTQVRAHISDGAGTSIFPM